MFVLGFGIKGTLDSSLFVSTTSWLGSTSSYVDDMIIKCDNINGIQFVKHHLARVSDEGSGSPQGIFLAWKFVRV